MKINGFQAANLLLVRLGSRIKTLVDSLTWVEAELLQFQHDHGDGGEPRFHLIQHGRFAAGVLEPGLQRGIGFLSDLLTEALAGWTHPRFEQAGLGFHGFQLTRICLEDDD